MVTTVALDLDGTISAGKSKIEEKNKELLLSLLKRYRVVIVGAGYFERILTQTDFLPVDVIGNYGMQYAEYSKEEKRHILLKDDICEIDRDGIRKKANEVAKRFSLDKIDGDILHFHPSGCFSLALIGTNAKKEDKLNFDPDRKKRREMYPFVSALFPEYTVFIGGNTSLDMAPKRYSKYRALCDYCEWHKIPHENIIFCGDDFGQYGNDESVYNSDIRFIEIDDYRNLEKKLEFLLK